MIDVYIIDPNLLDTWNEKRWPFISKLRILGSNLARNFSQSSAEPRSTYNAATMKRRSAGAENTPSQLFCLPDSLSLFRRNGSTPFRPLWTVQNSLIWPQPSFVLLPMH